MNFAFPALLIFLLVLPGITLRQAYLRGWWGSNSPFPSASITDEVGHSVGAALLLHVCAIQIVGGLGYRVDFPVVFRILTGYIGQDATVIQNTILSATGHPSLEACYFGVLVVSSYVIGFLAHIVGRHFHWDRFPLLRFRNEWFYLLSGEVGWLAERSAQVGELPAFVCLSAVVHQCGTAYIYRGIIGEYFWDKNGDLDFVLLREAHRCPIDDDSDVEIPAPIGFFPIAGDLLAVRYADMRTVNLEYWYREKADQETKVESEGTATSGDGDLPTPGNAE